MAILPACDWEVCGCPGACGGSFDRSGGVRGCLCFSRRRYAALVTSAFARNLAGHWASVGVVSVAIDAVGCAFMGCFRGQEGDVRTADVAYSFAAFIWADVSSVANFKANVAQLRLGSVWPATVFCLVVQDLERDMGAFESDYCSLRFPHHSCREYLWTWGD